MGRRRKDIVKRRKGSPFWWYDWTVGGRRFRGSTETGDHDEACSIALEERRKIRERLRRTGTPADRAPEEITLSRACALALEGHYKHLEHYAWAARMMDGPIRLIGGDRLLPHISESDLSNYVARRRGEHPTAWRGEGRARAVLADQFISAATVNHELGVLGKVFSLSKGWGYAVPDHDVRKHRVRDRARREVFLTDDQAEALLAAVVPHARGPIEIALYTGLRRSEVLGIRWENVRLGGQSPHIIEPVKGGELRTTWLIPEAVGILEGLQPLRAGRKGPVFTFGNIHVGCGCVACTSARRGLVGEPIQSIRRAFDTARQAVGLPAFTFHDLRHTVASWLLQRGYSLKVVQQVLHHADIATTQRYAHLEQGFEAQAMGDALARKAQSGHKKSPDRKAGARK